MSKSGSVQSIDRAFAIMQTISRRPAGISDLSRQLALPTSTVARILSTLESLGAVERIEAGQFRIGASVLTMAANVNPSRNITAVAQTHLVDLVEQLGEAVGLSIEVGYDVQYISQVDGPNEVQVRDWTGESIPMHVVSSGLIFLAGWTDDALESFLDRRLDQFTPKTETNPIALLKRIRQAQQDDYAWTIDELAEGLSSVAAPIRAMSGEVIGALHCHGPSYRFPVKGQESWVAGQVVERAEQISASLGYKPS